MDMSLSRVTIDEYARTAEEGGLAALCLSLPFLGWPLRFDRGSSTAESLAPLRAWGLRLYFRVVLYLLARRCFSPSFHSNNTPTILSKWPPNVFPTSSPTSPPARARSSKCTRLLSHSPLLPQNRRSTFHMANMWLTAHLQQYLPEPR